jgi:iron(III) transport system substrate-binding protein
MYSGRHYASDEALVSPFTNETGIKVNLIKADSDQLLNGLETKGEIGSADLFITPNVSRLSRAASIGLLAKLPDEDYSWMFWLLFAMVMVFGMD